MFKQIILPSLAISLAFVFSNSGFAQPQVVQLPTFNITGAGSTVVVPDGGSAFLGGISRSSFGTTSRGVPILSGVPGVNRLFRNQASGYSVQKGSMRVHARIIDLDEMDQEVLAEAARIRAARGETLDLGRVIELGDGFGAGGIQQPDAATRQKADFITRNIGRNQPSSQNR